MSDKTLGRAARPPEPSGQAFRLTFSRGKGTTPSPGPPGRPMFANLFTAIEEWEKGR